jgi:anti-sigma factor RsiW
MIRCEDIKAQVVFYLDDELSREERGAFDAHVRDCAGCREALNRKRKFLDGLRGAGPLYPAPAALRTRLAVLLREELAASPAAPPSVGRRRARRVIAWAAMLFLAFSGSWLAMRTEWAAFRHSPSDFAMTAVDVHQRYLRGALPLELASDSPDAVSAWFQGKVPFSLHLPAYQETSGQMRLYRLKGARLVGFNGDYAAYVAYDMGPVPIGLVVTSDTVATASGGERIVSKGLVFHHDAVAGFKVITWSDRGLTYALVSTLGGRGQESCLVCHAGAADRGLLGVMSP